MAFWRQEKKEPELFSWQSLSDEEKAFIIAAVKEEFHQMLEDSPKFEKAFEDIYWKNVQFEDEITIEYSCKCNISALRGMIRAMKGAKTGTANNGEKATRGKK